MRPLITVGIPTYNSERFIALAIKSVLNQSFTDFELIITDDGSTDTTLEIVRSFDDPRIMVIADGTNRGISYRLNQQIDMARGRYFCRMDSDDIMLPERLQIQLDYMQHHPEADIIGGGAIIIDDENNIIGQRCANAEIPLSRQAWINGAGFIHPSVFGKTEVFRKLHYKSEFKGVEDLNLWFRASKDFNLVDCKDIVIFYRDPLKLKLSIYLFRRRQNRKFLRSNEAISEIQLFTRLKKIASCYLKSLTYSLLYFMGNEHKLLARRNRPLSKQNQIYEQKLRDILG